MHNTQTTEADGTFVQIIDAGDGTATRRRWTSPAMESLIDEEPIAWEPTPTDAALPVGAELAHALDRAEAARRSAYDAVMAAGPRSMSRLEDADQAGSEAFRAVLRGEA